MAEVPPVVTEGYGEFSLINFILTEGFGNFGQDGPTPDEVTEDVTLPSGGIPEYRPFEDRDPYRFILPAAASVIEKVAQSQVDNLHLDEQQRFEQLARELGAEEIEFEARYLEALSVARDELLTGEIRSLLKKKDDEEAMLLIMIAANLT